MDTKPKEITLHEWEEIKEIPEVIAGWGLYPSGDGTEISAVEFANAVYGVKFEFTSGGPGYCGEMFILMGDALSGTTHGTHQR
jgi:hypothetical protein